MNAIRPALAGALLSVLAAAAPAQVHKVAFETAARGPTDTCVAASSQRVVVATNLKYQIFDRSGTLIPGDQGFPFESGFVGGGSNFFDPRVEYDAAHDRFWIIAVQPGLPHLHVAVSIDNSPDNFDRDDPATPAHEGDWYLYTGPLDAHDPDTSAFNFRHDSIPTEPDDLRFRAGPEHPMMNVNDDYLYVSAFDLKHDVGSGESDLRDGLVVFPLEHSGGSMLEGKRLAEAELNIVQPKLVDPPEDPDDAVHRFAVLEPHEEVESVQLFVSTSELPQASGGSLLGYDDVHDHIRLSGLYFDSETGAWDSVFDDMPLPSTADHFYNTGVGDPGQPLTPKEGWTIYTKFTKFDSGVLARDVNNELKVFAGHQVMAADGNPLEPADRHEFHWYVIDPDLANFPGSSWAPSIEVVGVAPIGSIPDGETYQGAISVNEAGAAYLTFTRSGTQGAAAWPSLVRARLSANYTSILYELPSSSQPGPTAWLVNETTPSGLDSVLGADYADIQPDPVHCGLWAVGTLVAYPRDHTQPVGTDERAIWLTEIQVLCNNAEMNGDGVVNEADLAAYLDSYAKGDQRADMDRSHTVDQVDYLIYSDEYAKR